MYLIYGKSNNFTRYQMLRKDIAKWMGNQKRDEKISTLMDEIIENTDRFIAIKNSQR